MIPQGAFGASGGPLANAIPTQLPSQLQPPISASMFPGAGNAAPNGILNGVPNPMHPPVMSANPIAGARGLGILNLLQQRNPALLARLQARFPQFGAGGIPPAFGMGRFPYGGSHQMTPYA